MSDIVVHLPGGRKANFPAGTPPQEIEAALAQLESSAPVSDGMARSFGQGATLGFGDEAAAGVRAAIPEFSNWMMRGPALQRDESIGGSPQAQTVSTAPTYDQRYDEELAKERQAMKAFEAQNPNLALGSEIAGGIASAGALSAAPVIGGLFRAGNGLASNIGRGVVGGAALGGAQGYGSGEGDGRLGGAMTGALVGAGAGAALPVVAKGAGIAYEKLAPYALNKVADVADRFTKQVPLRSLSAAAPEGTTVPQAGLASTIADKARGLAGGVEEDAAMKRLAQAIASGRGVDKARARLAELGDDAFIADTGKATERLANVGYLTSDNAADKYVTAYRDRNARTGERFINAMGDDANVPSIYDARRFLDANRKHVGETAYGAMDEAGLRQTPRLREMYENPEVKAAIDSVMAKEKSSRVGMSRTPASPVEIMHEVKRAIQNIGMDPNGRPAAGAFWWQNASDEFVRELKRANPRLAEADTAYREAVSLFDKKSGEGWLTRGQKFLQSEKTDAGVQASNAALHEELPRATRDQIQALRVGAANDMRATALDGAKATRRLADTIVESDTKQSKLVRIFDQERAAALLARSRAEIEYAANRGRVTAGSPTAERAAALARETALSPIPSSGGDIGRLWDFAKSTLAKADRASEPVRSRLADLLANPDRKVNAETLSLVEELLKRQAAMPRLSSGVAGSAGGAFSNSP